MFGKITAQLHVLDLTSPFIQLTIVKLDNSTICLLYIVSLLFSQNYGGCYRIIMFHSMQQEIRPNSVKTLN